MPVFRHASCGSEWIYVNLGDTYWLNHNHRKLWIANQIKSAQAIVLNASISGVIDMTTTNTPNDNNTRQNTACIENCWINTHPPFRKPYRKNTQINQQWHLQLCWKFHLIEPKLFGPILLSKKANLTNSVTSSISIPSSWKKNAQPNRGSLFSAALTWNILLRKGNSNCNIETCKRGSGWNHTPKRETQCISRNNI